MLMPQKKILIFAHARSASSSLVKIFRSQGIGLLYEPLNGFREDIRNCYDNFGIISAYKMIYKDHSFGMKHLSHSVDSYANKYLINMHRTIFLYRENIFDSALSWTLAKETGVYHNNSVTQVYYKRKYKLNPESFLYHLSKLKIHMTYKDEPGMMFVSHEDLLCDDVDKQKDILKNIFDYSCVNLRDCEAAIKFLDKSQKVNKQKWSDNIENYEEIVKLFEKNK